MAQNNALPRAIEHALAHLGDTIAPEANLAEVLGAFETIITTLQDSMNECDTHINAGLQSVKEIIQSSSDELADLPLWNIAHLKEAKEEVSIVVNATECAANQIMAHAETILNADSSVPEAYNNCVTDAVMQIFEACTFQDITGQRLSRVTEEFNAVESQVVRSMKIIGIDCPATDSVATDKDRNKRDPLLNGPANEGEGVAQEDIDALFD